MFLLQIALCDDEPQQLDILEAFLRAYQSTHGLEFAITRFFRGEALLDMSQSFQIIFMDIYLDGLLGTEVIRHLGGDPQVVFITTSREHAIEAFGLGAVHYLLKPLEQSAVWEAMDRCLTRLGESANPVLHIHSSQGSISIPAKRITYIEVFNKLCIVHTNTQQFQTYTSLNTLFEQLDSCRFLRPQRSFVVNMEFIRSFLSSKLILKDGTEISLSRNNRAELKAQYQRFLFDLTRR
ncbi:MAG: LytTR family DNA-binding domain-containing protein [Butyricicoccus pullicaecorum]|nr:LytTR family DNA-binding domain-containing protein [Butyricicoccus pullicaecorum]